jgi:hypothetical protein
MIPLSAGTPPPALFDAELRRPLTLDELEAMHGVEPDPRRGQEMPWNWLALVAVGCGLAGFLLPLLAVRIGILLP